MVICTEGPEKVNKYVNKKASVTGFYLIEILLMDLGVLTFRVQR